MKKFTLKGRLVYLLLIPVCLIILTYYVLPEIYRADYLELKNKYEASYRIYDRNGSMLREVVNSDGLYAYWIDYQDIPSDVINAVIAAEDERFYRHHGIDYPAFVRALFQNITELEIRSGASTITMQLARLIAHHPRNILGKIGQIFTARTLEAGLSKEEIICLYINMVPMGGGNLGMAAGAYEYFDTPLDLLSKSQIAFLAGLIQAPGAYNSDANIEKTIIRRNYVLNKLTDTRYLDTEDAKRARKEPVKLVRPDRTPSAMHFTDYVLKNLESSDHSPEHGAVYTTIDDGLNKSIEVLLSTHIQKMKSGGITHGAVLVIDNRSMEIISMVGSPDYWDGDKGSNNGTTMLRQPGSTLKPFTYAVAFSKGKSPADVIADIPINYVGGENKLYEPQNFSGRFTGPVTLHDALGRSLNVPAIRLANEIGIDVLLEKLHDFGIKSLTKDTGHYGLGLTLGNGEVSLLELVRGYSVFANKGRLRNVRWALNGPGKNDENNGRYIIGEDICFLITDILSSEILRIKAFGFDNPLLFEFPISIKTGTSSNWRDNWIIGYTNNYTIGVWVGNFSGAPTNQYSGVIGAGPLFQQIARLVQYSRKEFGDLPRPEPPENIVNIKVCPVSGGRPNEHCPQQKLLYVRRSSAPREGCDVHRLIEIDIRNGLIATEKVAPKHRVAKVYEYLAPEYYTWLFQLNRRPPPGKKSPLNDNYNNFNVVNPRDGEVYLFEPGYSNDTQSIELRAHVENQSEDLYWFVNNKVFEPAKWPYRTSLPIIPGTYSISFGSIKSQSQPLSILVK